MITHLLGATKALAPALLWLGGLIVVVVIAALVILKIRATMLARDSNAELDEGLLKGMRRLRDQGEMTQEEYDSAKRNMVNRMAGRPGPPPVRPAGEVRAAPGHDLTGAPLPDPPKSDAG